MKGNNQDKKYIKKELTQIQEVTETTEDSEHEQKHEPEPVNLAYIFDESSTQPNTQFTLIAM